MPIIKDLNGKIIDAVYFAEGIDSDKSPQRAETAFRELALLEKKLADETPPGSTQGDIARRGAVGAAMRAGDFQLAKIFADSFLSEQDVSERLKKSLLQLKAHIEKRLAESQ